MLINAGPCDPESEAALRALHYTPEERDRLFRRVGIFPLEEWLAEVPPATAEELEEMEELLRLRDVEREESLAREAGLAS